MDDRIGQQLGNYRLLRLLGQGGFADVYLSEHIHLHTQAAIKVLQLRLIENNVQSFLNEARTIAHLVHPYIIRVLDFGVQDDIPFLVMDYAPKGTFRQRFLNGHGQRLPATPLFPYIKQAAAALQYAHDKKLIHRDVKPENMLLGPNDEVLLSDFGFALIQSSTSRSSTETAGTAAYMAPEQLQGKPRPASDQYALGIIAYEWLTGSCPFQGTFFEIASQHMLTEPSPLHEQIPSLSPEVANVVMTALAKDPDQRFPSVRDFAIALERACLAAKSISLDEPLMPPPFLSEPYKSIVANNLSQQLSALQLLAGEKGSITEITEYPFKPLSSVAFSQSAQVKTFTANGGTWMNSFSLNDRMQQANQNHLASQASQPRPADATSLSSLDAQARPQTSEASSASHNLSQSGIRSLSGEQLLSQSNQSAASQHYHSAAGIRPFSADPNLSAASQSQNLSQSRISSWPQSEQTSQSNQSTVSQHYHSAAGIRPLSADPNLSAASQSQNLSQSRISSWPQSEQTSQSNQSTVSQHYHSAAGIRPFSADPNLSAASQSQNLSQSRISSWPQSEQTSQSNQSTVSQHYHSAAGIRPLSAERFSQQSPNSRSQPNPPSTPPATMAPSLSQQEKQPEFSSDRVQFGTGTKQQSSNGQLRAEFSGDLQKYHRPGTSTGMTIFFVIMMIFIIGGGAGLIYWSSSQSSMVQKTNNNGQSQHQVNTTNDTSASLSATATADIASTALANRNPYVSGPSELVINDSLSTNNQINQWQQNPQGGCQFTNSSYDASAASNAFTNCFATGSDYTNFTYQIQMLFIQHAPKYSSGGILFRGSTNQRAFYSFEVYASGRYILQKCSNGEANCTTLAGSLQGSPSPAYHMDQINTLTVVAKQNTFTLYINNQMVSNQQTDNSSPYTHGLIGVLARGGLGSNTPTQVAYSDIKVWQ